LISLQELALASQNSTSPEVTGELPAVTEATSVTGVPHPAVLTVEPAERIAKVVALFPAGARTTMGRGSVATTAPDVPVIVAVALPAAAELLAVSVRTLPVDDEL
jgi:hypothetical protein